MISDAVINQTIRNLNGIRNADGVPYFPTKDEIDSIRTTFKSLMKEERNKNLSDINQRTLVEAIVEDFSNGSDYYQVFGLHGDNKHMDGYDNFLRLGEGLRITEILNSYGLSTDVLKGVTLLSPFSGYTDKNNRVYVNVEIENPDGESPWVKNLEIRIDGNLVYQWKGRAYGEGDVYTNLNVQSEEIKQPKRSSQYLGSLIYDKDELPIKHWKDKNGRDFYTQGSRRVPRSLYEQ